MKEIKYIQFFILKEKTYDENVFFKFSFLDNGLL